MKVSFSPNGVWLVFETADWLFYTDEWEASRFSLIKGDRQCFNLLFDSDMVYAQVLGSSTSSVQAFLQSFDDPWSHQLESILGLKDVTPKEFT